MVPKPLNANVDANFKPTKQEIETFGAIISKNSHAAINVLDHSFLVKAIAKISTRIYLDQHDKAIAHKLQQKELEIIITYWLKDAKYQHPLIVPSSKKVTLKMKEFLKMALGKEQFSLDYCVGQVWGHLQPTLYKKFSNSNLPEAYSVENRTLHRNFMGYTTSKMQVIIGLGVSNISDSWYGFTQNVKGVEEYQNLIENNISPVYRGHILTKEDLAIRKHMFNLRCNFKTTWFKQDDFFDELPQVIHALKEMQNDGLVELGINFLKITQHGKVFLRRTFPKPNCSQ